jgi:hypothetical protein
VVAVVNNTQTVSDHVEVKAESGNVTTAAENLPHANNTVVPTSTNATSSPILPHATPTQNSTATI